MSSSCCCKRNFLTSFYAETNTFSPHRHQRWFFLNLNTFYTCKQTSFLKCLYWIKTIYFINNFIYLFYCLQRHPNLRLTVVCFLSLKLANEKSMSNKSDEISQKTDELRRTEEELIGKHEHEVNKLTMGTSTHVCVFLKRNF